ncbi:hypothetical protein V8B97DRAFT_1869417 [Scleroderma yunnanense]
MVVGIADLPVELIESILFHLDPRDISKAAQSGWVFRNIVYGADKQSFWRLLYLNQPLDDPRHTVTYLGSPRVWAVDPSHSNTPLENRYTVDPYSIDWCKDLQRIIRAEAVVHDPTLCREGELGEVLQALLDITTNLPSVPFSGSPRVSRNIDWVMDLLGDGIFLNSFERISPSRLTSEEKQLLARLHVWVGLTENDIEDKEKRASTRALVYNLNNYTSLNAYGPFLKDGTMRVDWVSVHALAHVYGMLQTEISSDDSDMEMEDDSDSGSDSDKERTAECRAFATGVRLPFCQSIIPPCMNLDRIESDWAGVEGLWKIGYCFLDDWQPTGMYVTFSLLPPLWYLPDSNASMFEDDTVSEDHHAIQVRFRITGIEPNTTHPFRPRTNYSGDALGGEFPVTGFVELTPDNQVRWHFGGGNAELGEWNCEGIGLGSVRSPVGIVGVWTTLTHSAEDPTGEWTMIWLTG